MTAERILVIKLGALGDVVVALGPMAAVRRHYAGAHITVLTRPAFEPLIVGSRMADRIIADPAPRPWHVGEIFRFRAILRSGKFDCIVDLQGSDRSRAYRALLWPNRPAHMFAQPRPPQQGERRHALDRHADVLHAAGIAEIPMPDLTWLTGDLADFDLPAQIVVLVPGSAPHRLDKRWPAAAYGELARAYAAEGITPVVVGSSQEASLACEIVRRCPMARDLTGRTGLGHIAALGRRATAAIGNDTGPMHILAGVGCPSLVLFSAASDPAASLPLGHSVSFLRVDRLEALPAETVLAAATERGLVEPKPGLG